MPSGFYRVNIMTFKYLATNGKLFVAFFGLSV